MAQAWHIQRRVRLMQSTQTSYWRASGYRPTGVDDPEVAAIEAVPGATWYKYDPFSSYRPKSKNRDIGAGAHLQLLKLESLLHKEDSDLFGVALLVFVHEHGLLGIFEEDYLTYPVLPEGKLSIAPEAVIEGGKLRRVDPPTEGVELALQAQEHDPFFEEFPEFKELRHEVIALPDEVRFTPKIPDSSYLPNEGSVGLVHWNAIKEQLGGLLVLDESLFPGVHVICTREPLIRWSSVLEAFSWLQDMTTDEQAKVLNGSLVDASPYVRISEDGSLERSYQCHNLLTAMYLMFYLDLTGGSTIKKCQSSGCPEFFRTGAQSDSKYCSERCASRAATRRARGLTP
jgi:hypothetical protein